LLLLLLLFSLRLLHRRQLRSRVNIEAAHENRAKPRIIFKRIGGSFDLVFVPGDPVGAKDILKGLLDKLRIVFRALRLPLLL